MNHAVATQTATQTAKREAALVSLTLTEAQQLAGGAPAEVVKVHGALVAFEQTDPRAARVVELKS